MIQGLRCIADRLRAAVGQRSQSPAAGVSRWAEVPPRPVRDQRRSPRWIRRNREETQGWVRWR